MKKQSTKTNNALNAAATATTAATAATAGLADCHRASNVGALKVMRTASPRMGRESIDRALVKSLVIVVSLQLSILQ